MPFDCLSIQGGLDETRDDFKTVVRVSGRRFFSRFPPPPSPDGQRAILSFVSLHFNGVVALVIWGVRVGTLLDKPAAISLITL